MACTPPSACPGRACRHPPISEHIFRRASAFPPFLPDKLTAMHYSSVLIAICASAALSSTASPLYLSVPSRRILGPDDITRFANAAANGLGGDSLAIMLMSHDSMRDDDHSRTCLPSPSRFFTLTPRQYIVVPSKMPRLLYYRALQPHHHEAAAVPDGARVGKQDHRLAGRFRTAEVPSRTVELQDGTGEMALVPLGLRQTDRHDINLFSYSCGVQPSRSSVTFQHPISMPPYGPPWSSRLLSRMLGTSPAVQRSLGLSWPGHTSHESFSEIWISPDGWW